MYQHLGRGDESAGFCQQTLARQLLDRPVAAPEEWAKNAVCACGPPAVSMWCISRCGV